VLEALSKGLLRLFLVCVRDVLITADSAVKLSVIGPGDKLPSRLLGSRALSAFSLSDKPPGRRKYRMAQYSSL